jgi:ethanolamine utilization microcompartment shell protein EutL
MDVQLRTYAFIDRLQPQAAAQLAATCHGDVPVAGMADLFIEVSPGNEIFRCADVALKAADVRPALQVVEREFGLLEIHARSQADVRAAGAAVLAQLGLRERDRTKPRVASTQFVTNVNSYQAQLINKWRKGNLLIPGTSLFVLEVVPAAYVTLAVNEAEKGADISLIEVRAVGRFGRLFVAGTESDIRAAATAATRALNELEGRE